ncbi:MAG: AAA family ATPase [Rikenellaceae bacterium]|nr:AAA family ATPase [Rikenellaceae bacterium]
MLSQYIASQIYSNFAFTPTIGQKKIIDRMAVWLCGDDPGNIFILNGYAGTGKTTLVGALVAALKANGMKSVLLAPTGRAAKIMARYTGEKAYTIHKKIYRQKKLTDPESGFSLDYNRESDTLFIIDEASMLTDRGSDHVFGSGSVLEDLVKYVRSGKRCRLMMIGDNAQLPPVGHDTSPALDPGMMSCFGAVEYASLDEVVRQHEDSGILFNATLIRCMLEAGIYQPPLFDLSFDDVASLVGGEFLEKVEECYLRYGKDETIIITRSNKRAGRFNEGIRRNVLFSEEELETGDMLMVVKNNYFYGPKEGDSRMEFIANGDIAKLVRLRRIQELYGFTFADATLEFPDYEGADVQCRLMLDTLTSDSPSLSREDNTRLFRAVEEDYAEITVRKKRYKAVIENPHFNALQVKFAYAVTCHKAQGGQWKAVFIDKMLFGEEQMSRDLMRWLYTAVTRATERLYFVNFDDRFFDSTSREGEHADQ